MCKCGVSSGAPALTLGCVLEVKTSGVQVWSECRTAGIAAGLCLGWLSLRHVESKQEPLALPPVCVQEALASKMG